MAGKGCNVTAGAGISKNKTPSSTSTCALLLQHLPVTNQKRLRSRSRRYQDRQLPGGAREEQSYYRRLNSHAFPDVCTVETCVCVVLSLRNNESDVACLCPLGGSRKLTSKGLQFRRVAKSSCPHATAPVIRLSRASYRVASSG